MTTRKKKTAKTPVKETKELETQEAFNPDTELKFGILAGLKQDGNYLFQMYGTEKTLTNLVGVEDYISAQLKSQKERHSGTGDALVHQLGKILVEVSTKLDRLLSTLEKPENEL